MSRQRHPLRKRARALRNQPSDAEYRLWGYLRSWQINGIKFRRQTPVGNYILDFVSFSHRLIIELDGGQHAKQQEYDERRTRWLEVQGFRVIRFWNYQVFDELDAVLDFICQALKEQETKLQR